MYRVEKSPSGKDVKACPHCARSSSHYDVAGRFQTGQDAPVGILTAALYEQLPPLTAAEQQRVRAELPERFGPGGDPPVRKQHVAAAKVAWPHKSISTAGVNQRMS